MMLPMTKASNGFDYNSLKWKALRSAALRKGKNRCCVCGQSGKYMYVDHKKSVRTRPDLAYSLDNLQVLCASHHNGLKAKMERRGDTPAIGLDGYPQASQWSAIEAKAISSEASTRGFSSPAYFTT